MNRAFGAIIGVMYTAALVSCGGGASGAAGDAAACPTGGAGEPAPQSVAVDGGVPLEELPHALAVARCDYWRRCFGLATYVANECVDVLSNIDASWNYQTCSGTNQGTNCATSTYYYTFPSAALLAAVNTGAARYDSASAGRCIAALLAEGCPDKQLVEQLPACTSVFTCPSGQDAGVPAAAAGADGGTDGGAACSSLLIDTDPFTTCTSDADCAGLTNYPEGPHCVGGICTASACGIFEDSCVSFAKAGNPCDGDALSILLSDGATSPTGACAPGLACLWTGADGGLGTCIVPQDVGGACVHQIDCKPGLACACGVCEIPPSSGACADGLCEVGVAYCEFSSGLCRPVHHAGDDCSQALNSCAPGLECDTLTICEVPTF